MPRQYVSLSGKTEYEALIRGLEVGGRRYVTYVRYLKACKTSGLKRALSFESWARVGRNVNRLKREEREEKDNALL